MKMTFEEYLLDNGEALNTIRSRENTLKDFSAWLSAEETEIEKTSYTDLMNYVAYCQSKGNQVHTIRLKIKSLAHYFDYLIKHAGNDQVNPAELLKLKGGIRKIPHGLLNAAELKQVYDLQTTYGLIQKRNKVLLSLVVFQAVGSSALSLIELSDIDLMNGTIYIPATRSANNRTLELKPQQLLLFQDYITNVRGAILREAGTQSACLLISQGQGKLLNNVISIVLKKLRVQFPKLKSLQQIRQSVITQWVKEHGLRKAQYMAGHRYVSSTERYNEDKLDGLKKELKMHYLLK